jgi:hypothetical protein
MDGPYAAERVGGVPDRPSPARVYDWFLGGSYNFPVDRALAAKAAAVLPELPQMLRANRAFLQRAVQYVAGCRVSQFLDLGSGLPTVGNVHTAARAVAPGARVVYVDVDPAVGAWCEALVGADPNTGVACADLLDTDAVLGSAAVQRLIDWSQPVGVLAVAVAHFIPDTAALRAAFARYRDVAVSGSFLALSHGNVSASPGAASRMGDLYGRAGTPLVTRSRSEIIRLVDGWDIVDPGVVPTWQWRPRPSGFASDDADPFTLALVARKP